MSPTTPSQRFNALPYDHRMVAGAVVIESQINQIRIDQEAAKAAHRKFMSDTTAHLRNLERSLAARVAEIDAADTTAAAVKP
jgi:hypothetical protein